MSNTVTKILDYYTLGLITEGERESMLLEEFNQTPPQQIYESLPQDIRKDFSETVLTFLGIPPEEVVSVQSVCVVDLEAYERSKRARIEKLNSTRPQMREFLKLCEQSRNCQ